MPRTSKKQQEAAVMKLRRIVAALDHDECLAILYALEAWSGVVLLVDRGFPQPELRMMSTGARMMAQMFREANQARHYIEEEGLKG